MIIYFIQREFYMKYIRILLVSLLFVPFAARAATNDFMVAAQLLAAAKNADIQQVQLLVNNGANVNYTDSTGLSIVCTALMNNDIRAAQILQMYGADASKCDQQIKQYNSRNKPKGSGGLFGGLSSAQSITLTAAGAAVVVGGLFLLTDVFDPDDGNDSGSGSGGNRPGGDGGGGDGGLTPSFTMPYGPAYLTPDGKISYSTAAYRDNLKAWDPDAGGVRQRDFNFLRPTVQTDDNFITAGITVPLQNYLLMMHGYSSFANGYMGQYIFRDAARNPVVVSNNAGGGKPVGVALITENGINPAGSAGRAGGIRYSDSASADSNTFTVDKYFNYAGPCVNGSCGAEYAGFDLSGSGTAMNPFATPNQNALAKIVAGWEAGGRAYGDLYGFVPNGRLAIYRTGGGKIWKNVDNPTGGAVVGTLTDAASGGTAGVIEAGDTLTLNGVEYKISDAFSDGPVSNPTITVGGKTYQVAEGSKLLKGTCTNADESQCENVSDIAIYMGTDGFYYVNSTGGASAGAVYVVDNNNLYVQKELVDGDIRTFEAMYNARLSGVSVIANTTLNPESRAADYLTQSGLEVLFSLAPGTDKKTIFQGQINNYYDKDSTDTSNTQGGYANSMFNSYNSGSPIIVMPAGEFEFGTGAGQSPTVLDATFENYAPALYDSNLAYQFMTVVAVRHTTGTSSADSIAGYGDGTGSAYGPLYLSSWTDNKGTSDESDDIVYMSRKCGIAGLGINGMDPWCFSAAGPTAEMAAAAAAGAVGAVKGAFDYMSNKQLFSLLALTADGPYLGTDNAGSAFTKEGLVAYLRAMFSLPPEYHDQDHGLSTDEYLKKFAEVYGYGLINLERAMTPKKSVYYYNGDKIVSANGNAYWRSAARTKFRPSAAFNPRASTISAPFYDLLESVDGEMSMPRVWKNEFALGTRDSRGLYMGDTLGDLQTRRTTPNRAKIGRFGFSMAMSARPYNDSFGGLDSMSLDYSTGDWNFRGGYQRYFTDGISRFTGLSNPVLGLASNAVVSDAVYNSGRWSFGGRAYSGAITDESLLENDPTISAQYVPGRLGLMQGAQSHVAWAGDKLSVMTAFGAAHETNTILGAQTDGLLNLGRGDTTYVDAQMQYTPVENLTFTARATFARTTSDGRGEFILGMSDVYSDAYAFGMDAGNFSLSVSRPLAVRRGAMKYAHADYEIIETEDGRFDLDVSNAYIAELGLSSRHREMRFVGTYRQNLGEFTDGAVGFIYRVNPNNTNQFGNESIFMMKLTHRMGI